MGQKNRNPWPLLLAGTGIAAILLIGFVIQDGGTCLKKAGPTRVLAELTALTTALECYRAEYGDYPLANGPIGAYEIANANILYRALVVSNAAYNPRGKIFFEPSKTISASTNFNSPTNYFVDPFGRPYQYRYPGDPQKSGTNFFDLFSHGELRRTADTHDNWETWAKNW